MQYMSSDKKDPQTGGQIPTNADSLDQQQMGLFPNALTSREPTNNEFNASTESDDLYKELWYIIKLIILPLLFAGISCLLVLPSIANGEAQETLWPLAITIIIVALLQGIAVHYTKDVFGAWILCTTGGFVLLLSISTFALFGAGPGLFLVLVLLAFTAYMLLRIIHPVHEGVIDIVLSPGEYKRTLYSGFNLLFPWEKVTHQINVQETHWNCPPQRIQLSRDEDVILRALISYQVIPQTAHLAAIQVENWEESLRDTFIATLQTIATVFTPDDFVNWPQSLREYQSQPHHSVSGSPADDFSESSERRESINDYLCQFTHARTAHWGVQINWVNIRDIELAPHSLATDINPLNQTVTEQQALQEISSPPEQTPQLVQKNGTTAPKPQALPALVEKVELATSVQIPSEIPSEEILIRAYKEVQHGKITDPEAIRMIAARFEAMARDAQANQFVSFDAERAALNLYKQAHKYEEIYAKEP
jgi:regulator of protease activity HflC (stomatin/prohibitin superfamily)